MIIFKLANGEARVARIAGVGGDSIAMRSGKIVINDITVPLRPDGVGPTLSDGQHTQMFVERLPGEAGPHRILDIGVTSGDDTDPVTVPKGSFFVLGDNRDDALDSRFSESIDGAGLVPRARIVGIVDAVVWSTARWKLGQPVDRLPPSGAK